MSLLLKAEGSGLPAAVDLEEARRFLSVMVDPEHRVMLQVLPGALHVNLAGDDLDGQCEWIRTSAGGKGMYYTINPAMHVQECVKNPHIVRRRWFFIDCDSIRPDRPRTNATEEEREAAYEVAWCIRDDLCDGGWPLPVMVDSGNGYHLYWRIDLLNDEESADLIKACLHILADRYDTAGCDVDTSTYDARRIAKIAGTQARKGLAEPNRPHRMCRILRIPDPLEVLTLEQLQALAASAEDATSHDLPCVSTATPMPGSLVLRVPPRGGPDAEARALAYLRRTPAAISGQGGHDACFWAARAVVWGFNLGADRGFHVLEEYNQTCQPPWSEQEMRHKCQDADTKPFNKPRGWLLEEECPAHQGNGVASARQGEPQTRDDSPHWTVMMDGLVLADGTPAEVVGEDEHAHKKRQRVFALTTMGHLMRTEFPPVQWVIPGVLSDGLNILAGAPKQGKSQLALNLGLTIAGGGLALNAIRVEPADVLYLSLEDQQRRIKGRAEKMRRTIKTDLLTSIDRRLWIATDWPRVDQGGIKLLDHWTNRAEEPRLLIVDVWNRISPAMAGQKNAYQEDAEAMGRLKEWSDRNNICTLVIHHTRKANASMEARDFVEEISGTLGLAGTADGVLVLIRQRNENQARLNVTGRDVAEQELVLEFDPEHLVWRSRGTAADFLKGEVQTAVIAYLRLRGENGAFTREISDANELKMDSVYKCLNRMLQEGIVGRRGSKWYYPCEEHPS